MPGDRDRARVLFERAAAAAAAQGYAGEERQAAAELSTWDRTPDPDAGT
jgi:hypothetical protein